MKWTELRPIQVDSIIEILTNDKNLIISSKTAGGKTEAAFLPILSKIIQDPDKSVSALYVGPLKALINDQFRRLEELCDKSEIPVFKWHGDVGRTEKKEFLKDPSGVLLITPESIESLFINRSSRLHDMFGSIKFIVIDEMHSFVGVERGAHLRSLISRIQTKSKSIIRLIGLSATLGDMNLAKKWLIPREPESILIVSDEGEQKELKFRLHSYVIPKAIKINVQEGSDPDVEVQDDCNQQLLDDLYHSFKGKTSLIFGNSKAKLEYYADLVKRKAEQNKSLHQFAIHHGSLAKSVREDTEEKLKSDRPVSVFCSSTLEMGIDVGNVSIIGQIDCPWSVSSLAQRIGRSGRLEEQPSIMRMFIEELEPDEKTPLMDRLHKNLIQSVAMTELMFEKWCEPPDSNRLHTSTLVQQILSIVTEFGGASVDKIYNLLISKGSFNNIDKSIFIESIHTLGKLDLLEQTPEGILILGLKGEKIVRSFDFYSAFKTTEEYRVVSNGRNIGSIWQPSSLEADSFLILAGKRWKIVEVDLDRKEITVIPSRGGKVPKFPPNYGSDIHPKIHQKMLSILFSDDVPIYLDDVAQNILQYARQTSRDARLDEHVFMQDGKSTLWFTWAGSRINRTLWGLAKYIGEFEVYDEDIALNFVNDEISTINNFFKQILSNPPTETELASNFTSKRQEKYDWALPETIMDLTFARNSLDLSNTLRFLNEKIGL
ncbi:MAG: DEAD/DEAH box helicase [Planctomycetes bacterium]|nr:DEAD/DEAH box helicase [Planctomycetota bacterium]